ncbi:MAG: hypothetical protein JXC32_10965 [Anaerolineae bacterium]|nr:hypothetical protein [Anaerolineae bacterium]
MKTRGLRVVVLLVVLALALLACTAAGEQALKELGDTSLGEAAGQPAEAAEEEPESQEPAAEEPVEQADEEGDTEEAAPIPDDEELEAVAFFVVSGTVYYDGDRDSRFSDTGADTFDEGATVTLVDAETGEVLDSQPTDGSGRYQFELREHRGDVAVVVRPNRPLAFGPPVEAGPDELPSGVDAGGRSAPLPVLLESASIVNAALQDPPGARRVVLLTDAGPTPFAFIDCTTGETAEASGAPIAVQTYTVSADVPAITITIAANALQDSQQTFIGIDALDPDGPVAPQRDDLALRPGTYAASAAFQGFQLLGTSALMALEDGSTVALPAAVDVNVVDDQLVVTFWASNFPGGLTHVVFTISDGEICGLSGPFEDDGGYRPVRELGPGVASFFEARDTGPFFDGNTGTGVLLSNSLDPQRTGGNTFSFYLDDTPVRGQFDVAAGGLQERIAQVGETYDMEPVQDIETTLLSFGTFRLAYQGAPYGVASFAHNGSAENPVAFSIFLLGEAPLTEEQMEAAYDVTSRIAETFRSTYQFFD